jgi:dihydroflavonol-4-reductase
MWHPHPQTFWRANVDGTRNVMQAALESGAGKVVHMSTVAVWGKPAHTPFDENTPPGPRLLSAYAQSKAAGEQVAWSFARQHGLPLTVLYPGIVLGAGDDRASGQYIQLLVFRRTPSTIFHNAPATYVAVKDVAEAVLLAAENPASVGRRYLIGQETLRGREYAALICQLAGVRPPPFRLPDWLVRAASYPFTALSALTHRPPLWTLSIDAARTLQAGFQFDGSRAERELGLRYTPVRDALYEAICDYRKGKTA